MTRKTAPVLAGLEEVADFQIIREWEKTTEFGDRAEIKTLPEGSDARGRRSTRAATCAPGRSAPNFERCFITLMHQRAVESDIIIVNHHLFFADLALRDENYEGGILPEYHAVVFDEAHEIEDVAGQYFGVSVSNYRLQELRRDMAAVGRMKKFGTPELDRILERLEELAPAVFRPVRRGGAARGVYRARRVSGRQRGDLPRPAGGAGTDWLALEADSESAGGD